MKDGKEAETGYAQHILEEYISKVEASRDRLRRALLQTQEFAGQGDPVKVAGKILAQAQKDKFHYISFDSYGPAQKADAFAAILAHGDLNGWALMRENDIRRQHGD